MSAGTSFLDGGGEAARLIRVRDWTGHPLGPPDGWPVSLQSALSLVLNSPESMILAWGPDLHFFFNDAYFPLLGPRLAWAMGERFDRVWADAWAQAKPIIDEALAGRPERFVDLPWKLDTDRGAADTWWTFSYSRVLDPDGDVAGLFILTSETTDRVLGDAALRESEERLRLVIEGAKDHAILTTDPDGIITTWSAGAAETFGWTAAEAVGQPVSILFTPEDRANGSDSRELVTAAENGCAPDERWHLRKDGRRVFMNGSVHPLPRDAQDRERGFIKIARDETERRRVSDSLRESEARFRTFAEAVPNHVWSASPDGKLEWANNPTYAYSGRETGDTIGDAWTERIHPDDMPLVGARWAASLASGDIYETEFRVRRADGVYRWFLVRALPVRGPDGAILRWIGANTDVEDQRAATEALARLNATLEQQVAERTADRNSLWQLSSDIMLRCTFEGAITAVNPAWTEMLGWREDELVGAELFDLIHPDDVALSIVAARQVSEGTSFARFDNRYRHRDGSYRWISWSARPAERLINAVGRDITADKEKAEALAQAEEALRQAQKMEAVGQLTGGIAHDFNNLLAGISGALELMNTRINQGRLGDIERYMVAAQGAAKRAAALTHRLLAFSRRQTLDPRPTNVNTLVNGMTDLVQRTVGPGIEVATVGAAGLWPALVDASQLENALLNLCINARDAMPDGGRITIETANKWIDRQASQSHDLPPGQYLSLCVSDTGTGMSPEVVEKAFEPFFTTKPIGQGTGLGLSMIYGFARQSGGQVRIYSEVGQGTNVCIYLPRHYGAAEPDGIGVDQAPLAFAEAGETVLIVDDEPTVRMLVADVLEDLGYTALEASDGVGGLKVLGSEARIDLLVTDVGLPGGMNGRQMAEAARMSRPDLKVLFITGYAENALLNHGQLEPGMSVLTKPFAIDLLAARMREMIGGTRK